MWIFRRSLALLYFLLFSGLLWYAIGAAWWEPYRYLHGHVESASSVEITITGAQRKDLRFCASEGWRYSYLYIIKGQRYTGYATTGCGVAPYRIGDKLPAIYDISRPNISYVEGDIDWNVFALLAAVTLLLLVGVLVILWRWDARRGEIQPEPGMTER